MKNKIKKLIAFCLVCAALFTLSGCFSKSADDLYSLPELSDEYVQLQGLLNNVLGSEAEGSAEYSAPTSGSYRQAVQFEDIDGDGEKEVLAFFNVHGDDLPLKIYIYEISDGEYYKAAVIEGSGTDIRSIDYVDMDLDGNSEIIVGWHIASGVSLLTAYELEAYELVQLFSSNYSNYCTCAVSGYGKDIVVLGNILVDSQPGAAIYSLTSDGEVVTSTARLSSGVSNITSVKVGALTEHTQAVFVEGTIDETSMITDVLTMKEGALSNITLRQTSGVSQSTARTYSVVSADIDGDGLIELPNPVQLDSKSDTVNYWIIEWYNFDTDGNKSLKEITYHNYSDGWFLKLPRNWNGNITVRRDASVAGERALIFSYIYDDDTVEDFLTVYSLSGTNRRTRAALPGREIIAEKTNTIYAMSIISDNVKKYISVNSELIKDGFNLIYSDISFS